MMLSIMGKTAHLGPLSVIGRARMTRTRLLGPLVPVLLIALLVRPMVWGRTFVGSDWYPHLWYIWHQAGSLEANHGIPSLFSYDTPNVFVPHYAFYGGTLYWFSGALALLVGSPATAMVLVFVMAFAASYGGWYWLGRQAGLGMWLAHAPAVLFVTSSHYLALPYGTGGYAEFVGLSMLAPLLASAWSILHADRLRLAPAAALAGSVILFCGSHNLTLLWGATILAIVLGAALAVVPAARRRVTRPAFGASRESPCRRCSSTPGSSCPTSPISRAPGWPMPARSPSSSCGSPCRPSPSSTWSP